MADEVARLDFATNIAVVTAEIARSLQQLQTQLEAAGSRSGTGPQVGGELTAGVQRLTATASEMGNVIQQTVIKAQEGMGKLSDLKGPTTLGGQFNALITELTKAGDVIASTLDTTSRKQLGGNSAIRAQLVEPITATINQLKEVQRIVTERIAQMSGEQAAIFQRFANQGQITTAVNRGEAYVAGIGLPTYDPAAAAAARSRADTLVDSQSLGVDGLAAANDVTIKARQREATAAAAAAEADEEYAQELRNLKVYLDEEIAAGRARRFANNNVNVDTEAGRVQYQYPSQLPGGEVPDVGASENAAHIADVRRAEQAAYEAEERRAAQQEKDSLSLTRQYQGVQRAHQSAIDTELKAADQAHQAARFAGYQAGESDFGRLAKSNFFATPEGPAKLTGAGLDTNLNLKEMDAAAAAWAKSAYKGGTIMEETFATFGSVKAANESVARSAELYSALLKKEGLEGLAAQNPGTRLLSGPYAQLGATLLRQDATGLQVVQGNEQVYLASKALAARLAQEARLATGGTSGGAAVDPRRGSVFDSFLGGAFGHGFDTSQKFDPSLALGNLAATAGVLARYGYEFKLIQGVLGGIKSAFTDLGEFQTQVVGLDEAVTATGADTVGLSQAFIQSANVAVTASQAIDIGTQGLQTYRSELAQGVSANTIFAQSVTAVGTAMLLTGKDAASTQKELDAAAQSFQLGSGGLNRINDAVQNAFHNYGGNRGEIQTALATAGGAAQEAGLTVEETANIVALIQSRTGDSGSAVASSINRLIARQDNKTFRAALGDLGVAETGNIKQEIVDLSKAYNQLTASQQQQLIVGLGGARALKDLLPVLRDGATFTDANTRSNNGSGAAADEFAKHLGSLSGQFKLLRTLITDILTNVGRTGIFAGIEVGLLALKPLLQGVNDLLTAFNTILPASARAGLGFAADIYLAIKAIDLFQSKIAGSVTVKAVKTVVANAAGTTAVTEDTVATDANTKAQVANSTARTEGNILRDAELSQSEAMAAAVTGLTVGYDEEAAAIARRNLALGEGVLGARGAGAGLVAGGEAGAEVGAASLGARGLALGGAAIGLLTNPAVLAIGGLIAIGKIKDTMDKFDTASKDSTTALQALTKAQTPEQLKTAADQFAAAGKEAKKSSDGIFGSFLNTGRGEALSGHDTRLKNFANDEATRIAAEQAGNINELAATAFGPGTSLADGLQSMKDRGVDAGTQMHTLAIVLGLVQDKAESASSALSGLTGEKFRGLTDSESTALEFGKAATTASVNLAPDSLVYHPVPPGREGGPRAGSFDPSGALAQRDLNIAYTRAGSQFRPTVDGATKAFRDQLAKDGFKAGDVIPEAELNNLADAGVKSVPGFSKMPQDLRDQLRAKILASLRVSWASQTAAGIEQQRSPLNDTLLQSALTLVEPQLAKNAQDANPLRIGSGTAALKGNVDILKRLASRATDKGGVAYAQLTVDIQQAEAAYIDAKVKDLDTVRQAAEKAAGANVSKVASIRRVSFAAEIAAAHESATAIVGIFDQMTQGEINLELTLLDGQVKIRQAAVNSAKAAYAAIVGSAATHDPDLRGAIAEAKSDLEKALAALGVAVGTDTNAHAAITSGQVTPADNSNDSALQAAQAAHLAQINASADPRNQVQQAQTALSAANYQLSIAKKGTADFYNAEKAVTDAQFQLANAQQALATAAAQAVVFPGSKLQAAAAEITVAAGELKAAERNTVEWYKAVGDMRKAQLDYAEAINDRNHTNRLLKIDITDPVAQAKEAIQQAKDQYAADKKNRAPSDVLNADREKIREANSSEQQTAFDQKLQDEKTAFDLQQISATQYLTFLEHQRAVLQSIHHRTRQQIDELNSVDQAIKGIADQMNGQFNIGDIKIPTPYEARRSIQASSQGQAYQSTAVTNQTNVTINGTDIALVQKTLWQILGPSSVGRTTVAPRKA